MSVDWMLWGSDRHSNPVQMVVEGWNSSWKRPEQSSEVRVCLHVEWMLWGSDRHSNPVQMVVEGWLYLEFSSPICSLLDWLNKLWTGLLQKLWLSTAAKTVEIFDENYFISIASIGNRRCYAHVRKTSLAGTPRILSLAWLRWYADSRLRHTAGLIFVLRLKFEVCAVEPCCTCVKAKTGDKALTSWWAKS